MRGSLSPKLTVLSVGARYLCQVCRQHFTHWHLFCTQDMPEISEPPDGCEPRNIDVITQIDHIQTKRRARWERMINFSILFIPNRQHGHFHRYDAPLTVILQHLIAYILRGHKLTYQAIVIDVDIVDQSIDLIRVTEGRAYDLAKCGYCELRDAASRNEARCPCTQ